MTDDALKAAERSGYQKGYNAGKRLRSKQISADRQYARERAFWQRAMLAAIEFAMTQSTWKRGDTPINSTKDRMVLAGNVADAALKVAKDRYQI